MLKKNLFIVCLLALVLPLQAQKVKIDRENIFADKKEKLVYDAAYKKLLPTDTYAYLVKDNPLQDHPFLPSLGKEHGKIVKANESPDYLFELTMSQINEPKIEYIKVSDLNPRLQNTNYIARITYMGHFDVKILNKEKEVVKTIIISNEKTPYVYYYSLVDKQMNGKRTPEVISTDQMANATIIGWTTPELLALRLKEERAKVINSVVKSVSEILFEKAHQEISFMMCDIYGNDLLFKFQMYIIKEKQQQEYPELTARLEDLRRCIVQWARHKDDADNLQKLATLASYLEEKTAENESKSLKLLYKMNAALAYIICQNFEKGARLVHESRAENMWSIPTIMDAAERMYSAWKKYNVAKQSGDTFDATQSFDLEKDYKNLSQR